MAFRWQPRHPRAVARRDRAAAVLLAALVAGSLAWFSAPASGALAERPAAAPAALAQDAQEVPVQIDDGSFATDYFNVQQGDVRLAVTTRGGPYTLSIPPLVDPHPLPANSTVYIGFTAPEVGEYTMRLAEQPNATATLNVCEPGFC